MDLFQETQCIMAKYLLGKGNTVEILTNVMAFFL